MATTQQPTVTPKLAATLVTSLRLAVEPHLERAKAPEKVTESWAAFLSALTEWLGMEEKKEEPQAPAQTTEEKRHDE